MSPTDFEKQEIKLNLSKKLKNNLNIKCNLLINYEFKINMNATKSFIKKKKNLVTNNTN